MKKAKVIEKITAYMDDRGVKYTWLCKRIEVSNGHLSNVFNGIRTLTPELMDKINKALGTEFKL